MNTSTGLHDFVEETFNDLLKAGNVDQLEIYCSSNRISGLRIVNSELHESRSVVDSGLGVRVLSGGFTGYASVSSPSVEGARETYTKATKVANTMMGERESITFAKPSSGIKMLKPRSSLDARLDDIRDEELASLGRRMIDSALSQDNRVCDCSGSITLVSYEFTVMNSNGIDASGKGGYVYATLTSMSKDGEHRSQGFDTLVTKNYRSLVEGIDETGKKSAQMSVGSLGSRQPVSGRYEMIFKPSCLTSTMRNLGLMANGRRVQDGLSMFTESLNRKVASDMVNMVEDGQFEDGIATCSVDDEGLPTRRTSIVERGVLKSFIHDSYTASKTGAESTGNGFRVWTQVGGSTLEGKRYDFPPTCSSVNFMLLPGELKEEELVEDTKRGILMGWTRYERLLNNKTGAFTANARSGNFMVENGELKYPIHGFRIHDSYSNLLMSVNAVVNKAEQKGHWGMAAISPTFRAGSIQIIAT